MAKALVFFHIASSRGRKESKEIPGEKFSGVIISDYYNAYHKLCGEVADVFSAHNKEGEGINRE
ncbi:MAG: transposase [Nitrospirae bacterium]|nr:transposase [Nitrospirota bacterium]